MTYACSGVVIPPRCDKSWNNGEEIFLGKAVSQLGGEKQLANGIRELTDYEFHFAPTEVFKGASKQARELIVYTGHGMGDCSEPFIVGESYLVYVHTIDGHLKAWTATPEAVAGGTLNELRAIARGGRPDDLFGTIGTGSEYGSMKDRVSNKPLANVVVNAVGQHGARFSVITDEHGTYAFASLPSGRYQLEAASPFGLIHAQFPAYVVTTKRGGAGCRIDVFRPLEDHGLVRGLRK